MTKKPSFALKALAVAGLTVFTWGIEASGYPIALKPAIAQDAPIQNPARPRTEGVWQKVYELLPDLPKENQYISKETGKTATENTLVGRFIRYHMYVKGRPPIYRLDWKLTMADYLSLNEIMNEKAYPGGDTLRQNPMDSDRAAISRLTRAQRDALINTLVSIFNPNAATQSQPSATPSVAPPPPATGDRISPPPPSQPGDAQKLKL